MCHFFVFLQYGENDQVLAKMKLRKCNLCSDRRVRPVERSILIYNLSYFLPRCGLRQAKKVMFFPGRNKKQFFWHSSFISCMIFTMQKDSESLSHGLSIELFMSLFCQTPEQIWALEVFWVSCCVSGRLEGEVSVECIHLVKKLLTKNSCLLS